MNKDLNVSLYIKFTLFILLPIILFLFSSYYYKPTMQRPIEWNAIYAALIGVLVVITNAIWVLYDKLNGFFGFIIGGIISILLIVIILSLIVITIIFFRIDIFFSLK